MTDEPSDLLLILTYIDENFEECFSKEQSSILFPDTVKFKTPSKRKWPFFFKDSIRINRSYIDINDFIYYPYHDRDLQKKIDSILLKAKAKQDSNEDPILNLKSVLRKIENVNK